VKPLLANGKKVGAVTRNRANRGAGGGADLVVGDPSRPKTLASALRGVEGALPQPGHSIEASVEMTVHTIAPPALRKAPHQGPFANDGLSNYLQDVDFVERAERLPRPKPVPCHGLH
jgi:hypothetical protein